MSETTKNYGKKYEVNDKGILDLIGKQDKWLHNNASWSGDKATVKETGYSGLSKNGVPFCRKENVKSEKGNEYTGFVSWLVKPRSEGDRDTVLTRAEYETTNAKGEKVKRFAKNYYLTYNTLQKDKSFERKTLFVRVPKDDSSKKNG